MNRFIIIGLISFFLLLISCNGTKKHSPKNEQKMENNEFQLSYNVSPRTHIFLKEFKEENLKSETIKISKKMIKKYGIKIQNEEYYISGLIRTNHLFEQNKLSEIQVFSGLFSGNILTVQVPLKSLNSFLNIQGIEYFEISENVTK